MTINGSTVSGNFGTTAGDIINAAGTVTVNDSEVDWGTPQDCLGIITNGGGNQPSDGNCGF